VGIIPIIVRKDFAPVVGLEEPLNYGNQVGEIDIVPLMVIKDFTDKVENLKLFNR